MTDLVEHITVDGDRWDLLAWLYRNDPLDYEPILLANRHVPFTPELEGGIRLVIPRREIAAAVAFDDPGLPLWRRAS